MIWGVQVETEIIEKKNPLTDQNQYQIVLVCSVSLGAKLKTSRLIQFESGLVGLVWFKALFSWSWPKTELNRHTCPDDVFYPNHVIVIHKMDV